MTRLNSFVVVLLTALLFGCASTPSVDREKAVVYQAVDTLNVALPTTFFVKSADATVPFHGALESTPDNPTGSMLYSGDAGAGGLLAQIIAHAVIANSAQKDKLAQAQQQSDEVLLEYQEYIERNTLDSLIVSALENFEVYGTLPRKVNESADIAAGLVVESYPTFYLSQDEKTIFVEHHLKAFYAELPEEIIFENMARVLSLPIDIVDFPSPWLVNDGEKFFEMVSSLYQDSFNLLVKDMYKKLHHSEHQKTYKYYMGNQRSYVRGSLIDDGCVYTVIRDLRGNVIALPKLQNDLCLDKAETLVSGVSEVSK